jgi:hypothetical protein
LDPLSPLVRLRRAGRADADPNQHSPDEWSALIVARRNKRQEEMARLYYDVWKPEQHKLVHEEGALTRRGAPPTACGRRPWPTLMAKRGPNRSAGTESLGKIGWKVGGRDTAS